MYIHRRLGALTDVATGRSWESARVRQEILQRVTAYGRLGVKRGDRVLIQHGNSPKFFADLLAIWTLGACAIPVDTRLTAFEVERLVSATGARVSLVDGSTQIQLPSRDISVISTQDTECVKYDELQVPHSYFSLDDPALIMFTSGSTGDPKGVVHSHRSLLSRWTALSSHIPADACARTLCLLPTSFGHGLICNSLFPWLWGHHLFIGPPFRPDVVASLGNLIDEWEISFLSSVPSLWILALRVASPPTKSTLRRIHVGSAPLSAALWKQVQEWSRVEQVFNMYGITEVGSWIGGLTEIAAGPEDGLIGQPWGCSFSISPARNTGDFLLSDQCQTGQEGMIWVNTPGLMTGYFQRDDLTQAAIANGWFRTGDIGLLDRSGRLFIKGREREEINKGGFKIFPADVDLVAEKCAGIIETCTFAIEDRSYGENVAIAVVLNGDNREALPRLHQLLTTHLAAHKHPSKWYLLDYLPRNGRGKVQRHLVKKLCEERKPLDPIILR